MKRGQGTSQVIVFILALLIGSMVLIFGARSLIKIRNAALETEKIKFQSGLESELTGLSYGSTRKKSLNVPGNYLSICFAELSYLRTQGEDEFTSDPDYAVVKDSVFSDAKSNVFLMPDGIWSFHVGALEVQDGFKCFNLSAGHTEVGFEGLGDKTRVHPYTASAPKPAPEQCGDGICQATENFETCSADCPPPCIDESTIENFDSYSHKDVPEGWEILSSKPRFGRVMVRADYAGYVSSPNALKVYVSAKEDVMKTPGLACWFRKCNSVAQTQLVHNTNHERYSFDAKFIGWTGKREGHIDISHSLAGHIFVGNRIVDWRQSYFDATDGEEKVSVGRVGVPFEPDTQDNYHHFEILVDWALGEYDLLITEMESGTVITEKSKLKVEDDVSSGNTFTITQDDFGFLYVDNLEIESLCEE